MNEYGLPFFAETDPDSDAVIELGGRSWTRRQLFERVNRISRVLRELGLSPGDVLAILSPNCLDFIATHLAAMQVGLYVVPVNWHLSADEISYILQDSGARALFVHERLAAFLRRLTGALDSTDFKGRISFGQIIGFTSIEDLIDGQSPDALPDAIEGRTLMYTSATTGRPKAINLPIRNARLALEKTICFHIACGIALGGDNVHLCATPLYHAAPLEFVVIALHMGHSVVMLERWEPGLLLETIDRYRITTSFMVPAMFIRFLKLPVSVRSTYDVSSLRLVAHSAAPCPAEVKEDIIRWWGPIIWEGYGAAEGSGTAVSSAEWLQYPGTVGRPIQGSRLLILDDEGVSLPPHQAGTVYFSRFTGDRFEYKNDPEKTKAAYRGEVFTVGDIGYVNEEGYLYICDRKIDMIICGGMNVYSAEVEQALVQHPKVLDCAVLGIPDSLMGEAVHAIVQATPGVVPDGNLTSDLLSFLRLRLSSSKLPKSIEYMDQLPRDPNGKLYKRLLRDRHWVGLNRNV